MNKPLVEIENSGYKDFFKEILTETKYLMELRNTDVTRIANKHSVDVGSFIMDCAYKEFNDCALFRFNNDRVIIYFEPRTDKNQPATLHNGICCKRLSKDSWDYLELYTSFDFWDIQHTIDKISQIESWQGYRGGVGKLTAEEEKEFEENYGKCPEFDEKEKPIYEMLQEGYKLFPGFQHRFEDFCYQTGEDIYDI